jgi:DNA excision repair protein ERCC-6-like 2
MDIEHLDDLPWSCVFVDEAHFAKNDYSRATEALHRIRHGCRFGLTGTVIQNSYNEMWTVLNWTNPGELGSLKQWKGFVTIPLSAGQSSSASNEVRATALVEYFSVCIEEVLIL